MRSAKDCRNPRASPSPSPSPSLGRAVHLWAAWFEGDCTRTVVARTPRMRCCRSTRTPTCSVREDKEIANLIHTAMITHVLPLAACLAVTTSSGLGAQGIRSVLSPVRQSPEPTQRVSHSHGDCNNDEDHNDNSRRSPGRNPCIQTHRTVSGMGIDMRGQPPEQRKQPTSVFGFIRVRSEAGKPCRKGRRGTLPGRHSPAPRPS